MLSNLELFLRIVEMGGMAAAGRETGLSPSSVSARLAALEEHYGVRLLHRTTRSLSPTPEGLVLLEGARRILEEVQTLHSRMRWGSEHVAGSIRISAPIDLGESWLCPILDRLLKEHPDLRFDLHLSDGFVDLTGGGYDLALRYGTLPDSSLRVRELSEVRRVLCAAPSYLERAGTPKHPDDLKQHNCLLFRFGEELDQHWPFRIDGKETRVLVRGDRTANNGALVRQWCLDGHGIVRKSEPDVARDLEQGRLVILLEDFESSPINLQLVWPGGRPQARRVGLLIDRLVRARDTLITAPGK